MKTIALTISALSLIGLSITLASAQTTTGAPGSPSATTTLSGEHLPPPDPQFGSVIEDGALQSKPRWPPCVVPPRAPRTYC